MRIPIPKMFIEMNLFCSFILPTTCEGEESLNANVRHWTPEGIRRKARDLDYK